MSFKISISHTSIGSNPEIKQMQKLTTQMLSAQITDIQKTASKIPAMQNDSQALIKSLEKLAQAAKIK